MSLTVRIGIALAAVWLIAAAGLWLVGRAAPNAAKVEAGIQAKPLAGRSGPERKKAIEKVAAQMNGLTPEEREKLRRSRAPERYFATMTEEERLHFMDLMLPAGFRQMMEAFNKMEPQRRREMVRRALEGLEKNDDGRRPEVTEEMTQKIVDQGLRSFYNDASAETKMDLAPLIEGMQARMQRLER